MCFSAPASLIAGITLSAVGRETLKKTKEKNEYPFAAIPLIFGIQQITEGIVWLAIGLPVINQIVSFAFLMFAYVLWPIFIPIAVYLIEKEKIRKTVLKPFVVAGLITGLLLFYSVITGPVYAQIHQFSIVYNSTGNFPAVVVWLYAIATSLSCLASSHKMINLFGLTLFASGFVTYQCYANSFVSVWCFFSALLSIIVHLHFSPVNELVNEIKSRFKLA